MSGKKPQVLAGLARAKSMSSSERKALATKAAHERWKKQRDAIPRATHDGEWKLTPSLVLYCAVLEDGRRIFSERSLSEAFAHVRSGSEYKKRKDQPEEEHLPVFVSSLIADYLSPSARERLSKPIRFHSPRGGGIPAWGIDAELLPELCDAYLAAREAGVLTGPAAQRKAQAAERLLRALAKVGVAAIVDEVTGYQFERDKAELQKLLAKYVSEEYRPWTEKFPTEFYSEIFRLKGKTLKDVRRKPQWLGHVTNNVIYSRLLPGIREKLAQVNPVGEKGYRARKHHQHFSAGEAEEHLIRHIANSVILMRASRSWTEFEALLDRALPKRKLEELHTTAEE